MNLDSTVLTIALRAKALKEVQSHYIAFYLGCRAPRSIFAFLRGARHAEPTPDGQRTEADAADFPENGRTTPEHIRATPETTEVSTPGAGNQRTCEFLSGLGYG